MSSCKRILSLLLCLVLCFSLAPAAHADGDGPMLITNYQELSAAMTVGGTGELRPAADFGWPEEGGTLVGSIPLDLQVYADWTIPENVTLRLAGKLRNCDEISLDLPGRVWTPHTLTVDGTLDVSNVSEFSFWRLVVNGTLVVGNYFSPHIDEGLVSPSGLIRAVDPSATVAFRFYYGPRWEQEHTEHCSHWVFHQGAQLIGREDSASAGSLTFYSVESSATHTLYHPSVEAVGTVSTDMNLETDPISPQVLQLNGGWSFYSMRIFPDSTLFLNGSVRASGVTADGNLIVPEGSALDVENWTDLTRPGGSISGNGSTAVQVDGSLTLGVGCKLRNIRLIGTGTLYPLARNDSGLQQPYFLGEDGSTESTTNFTAILQDREAYADLVAVSLNIVPSWNWQNLPPQVLSQPRDVTVHSGETAVFTVEAQWAAGYLWQYSTDGTNWRSCATLGVGYNTDTFSLTAQPEYNGYQFRCRIRGTNGNPLTDAATLTVLSDSPIVNPFLDVGENSYYYDAVVWAIGHHPAITTGTDETHFSPNQPCTRAQAVTFLWRAFGCPDPQSEESPFTDVDENAYYYKAMLWAVEHGVTAGTSDTSFSPNSVCSRSQAVTFLWRATGSPDPGIEQSPFTDVDENAYYYKAMLWALEHQVTTGTSGTSFSPNAACTRGQTVTFLYRAVGD